MRMVAEKTGDTDGKRLALAASCAGIFLAVLRSTSANTALPEIRADLGGAVAGLQWVAGSYTLVLASLLLSVGALTDRLGAKRLFLAGLGFFALFSALSAAAPSLETLIAFQVPLGVAGALLGPPSLAIIGRLFAEPSERARAIGLWAASTGLAVAAGPVLGGVLTGALGWRGLFLVNVPLALLVAAVVARFVPETARASERGLDPVGQAAGVLALFALTFGLIEGGRQGFSVVVVAALAIAIVCALALLIVEWRLERRGAHTMLPLGLFCDSRFSVGTAVGVVLTFCVFGQIFLLSLFFGSVLGYPALLMGLAFLPLAVVTFGASILAGVLTSKVGPRWPTVVGCALASLGSLVLLLVGEETSYLLILANLLIVGIGGGLVQPSSVAAVLSSAPTERTGVASAVVNASRQVGGVLGIALLGSLVAGEAFVSGLHLAGYICAGAFLVGAALSFSYLNTPGKGSTEQE
jgi:DHA2 family methylenomycin A resistance protein-like MFS transporter